ncbi:MAG: ATP-binding protein [Candidatus Riflebacteria bacterium HGW-Riflebacteria-2]|jgi:ABC-type iron transport system FetAB ATPase subunit|nr:MAG: ATP-binding protein [Candidatus Riflebacteria bacterium HGW-Riflebacteria-2]
MKGLRLENLSFLERGPYTFTVESGQVLGLHGASGAGKTLLLRAIADLESHDGHLWLDQTACSELSGPQWRRRVAYLPAESLWWYDRVGQHFSAAPESVWLQQLGLAAEVMDWEVNRLSTGEKQRLAILRLLQNRPHALLLDEPTASLDQGSIGRVEEFILSYLRQNSAPAIWVSHDPVQLARVAARRMEILAGGEMREQA